MITSSLYGWHMYYVAFAKSHHTISASVQMRTPIRQHKNLLKHNLASFIKIVSHCLTELIQQIIFWNIYHLVVFLRWFHFKTSQFPGKDISNPDFFCCFCPLFWVVCFWSLYLPASLPPFRYIASSSFSCIDVFLVLLIDRTFHRNLSQLLPAF